MSTQRSLRVRGFPLPVGVMLLRALACVGPASVDSRAWPEVHRADNQAFRHVVSSGKALRLQGEGAPLFEALSAL